MPSAIAQPVAARLTRSAIFLVVTVNPGADHEDRRARHVRRSPALVRAVGFRDLEGRLSCVMGFGSDAWDRLFGAPKPRDLHPFREIRGRHHAVATPGDLLFHIRAARMDLCFELASQIMSRLGDAVAVADEVHGFRYFDQRDLLGFVDGTENPAGQAAVDATIIGAEDAAFAGGSYVIVQKYLHDLAAWNALPVEAQEKIIGRTKLVRHRAGRCGQADLGPQRPDLDRRGRRGARDPARQHALRHVGKGEFGTYFIGYARSPAGSSGCSRTCSWACRPATTTASWTSAAR